MSRIFMQILTIGVLFNFINCLEYKYHNYNNLTQLLQNYASKYSNKVYLYSIGKTLGNREQWVLAISNDRPREHVLLRPEAKYVGNMHGNEASSRELLIHFIDYLLTNQTNDENIDYLLKNTRIHVLVSMNPDGFEISSEGDCFSVNGRYNLNGYDLNRNFPDKFEDNPNPIQIETQNIMNWLANNSFILSANFHSGEVVANYPFDNYAGASQSGASQYSSTQEDNLYRHLAKTYSLNHGNMINRPCGTLFKDGITNGAEWYPLRGGMQDYNYWKHGCLEVTMEVSCCKYPLTSNLRQLWIDNKNSLIEYMKLANTGIKGVIRLNNGKPAANLSILIDSIQPIFKTNSLGEYYRILLPGTYKLSILLDCIRIQTYNFEIKASNPLVILNITLTNINSITYESYNNLNKFAQYCPNITDNFNNSSLNLNCLILLVLSLIIQFF